MRRNSCWAIGFIVLLALVGSGISGAMLGGDALQPRRRPLTPERVRNAEQSLQNTGATWEDFAVRAPDGVQLRGWKVRAREPNGEWACCFTANRTIAPA